MDLFHFQAPWPPGGVIGLAFEVGQQQAIHPGDVEEKVHLLPLRSRETMAPYRCWQPSTMTSP